MIESFVRVRTTRRSGAEFTISLRKRRQWFADDPDKGAGDAGNSSAGTENTGDEGQQDNRVPYSRFHEVNEAKKAAEAKVKSFEDEKARQEQEKALKDGEFQKVIEALKPKAERVEALEKSLTAYLEKEVAEIPEAMRTLIPQGDVAARLEWVIQAKAAGLFTKQPKAPPMDGGKQGDGGGQPVKLSDMQRQMAALAAEHGYAVKPEDLAARQKEIDERRKRKPEKQEE